MRRRLRHPRIRWSLGFAALWGLSVFWPVPRVLPTAWTLAYVGGVTAVLVGLMAAIAAWHWFDRTRLAQLAGLIWLGFALGFGLSVFPLIPHSLAFWARLPWTRPVFWSAGCGVLMGSLGFWGLIGQAVAWGLTAAGPHDDH